jgi:hypothetical protein
MQEREFIEPNRSGMVRFAAYVIVVAICMLPFITAKPMMAHLKTIPVCEGLPWARAYLVSGFAVAVLAVAFFGWFGYQTIRTGQSPLPDAIVFRRTEVTRGPGVVRRGYFLLGLAAVLLVIVLYVALLTWPLFRPLFIASSCGGT